MEIKFRDLTADDIECRVAQVSDKGCQLLLYKDARCDMRILDATVGADGWQREHYECKGNLFCRIGIKDKETGEWVYKSDCGSESNMDKEKGEASDSFKRACINWGIGRELYTPLFIWVSAENVNLTDKGGKKSTYDKFEVEKVKVENGVITGLAIRNKNSGKRVYTYMKDTKKE